MIILKKNITPDDVTIQLEDLTDGLGARLAIGVYTVSPDFKRSVVKYTSDKLSPKVTRLMYSALVSGELSINELQPWQRNTCVEPLPELQKFNIA